MGDTPNPGSDEAIRQGCTCPILANYFDAPKRHIEQNCPLHGDRKQQDQHKTVTPVNDRLAGLERVASETVAEAKGGCGRFNQHIDCTPYTSRGKVCPECPYELVEELEAALSSAAPCPECGGSRERVGTLSGAYHYIEQCPRCSAQPAPSDVVPVPRNVAEKARRLVIDVSLPATAYQLRERADVEQALAAALRQGGR